MKTIEEQLYDRMSEFDIEGDANDFLQVMTVFLMDYTEHVENSEPSATVTIRNLKEALRTIMNIDEELDTPIQ